MSVFPFGTGFAYLATAYTNYPDGHERAYVDAAKLAAKLVSAGIRIFCPITHTHAMAYQGGLDPLDLRIWKPLNEPFLMGAHSLIVGRLPGWDTSEGVAYEIAVMRREGKPIFDCDPKTGKLTRRPHTVAA